MAIVDVRKLEHAHTVEADVCIVGAGAAGLTLAAALGSSGRDVCVLEAGGFAPDRETQSLYDLENVGYPLREHHMARARYFGGTCNLWAGRAMKLARTDVRGRPWLDDAPWPLRYEELDEFYAKAGRILRLPDQGSGAFDGASEDERLLFGGNDLAPNVALWARKPLRFGRAYRSQFRRRGLRLYLHANATEIVLDDAGQCVECVVARSLSGKEVRFRARSFVLAAGGLENARLLLVSKGKHPAGIGNQHDLVGRFYMDHPRVVYGRVKLARPVRLPTVLGSVVSNGKKQLGIAFSEETQRREGLLNTYSSLEVQLSTVAEERYRTSIGVAKVLLRKGHAGGRFDWSAMGFADVKDMIYLLTPKEIVPHSVYRSYAVLRKRLFGDSVSGMLTVVNYCEQLPDPESRVYLSHERDRLGMNKLALKWKVGSDERRSVVRLHQLLDEQLRRTGIGRVESDPEQIGHLVFTDASHHMGTTRMSSDPKRGVVDPDCRVHGVANLYIAGSSVFPNTGNANPTWTIVALALRLAEHLQGPNGSSRRGA